MKNSFADDQSCCKYSDRQRIFNDQSGVYHHSDRNEKDPGKRSLTGVKSFFVVSVKAVPESSEPIRKAPNADEKPILVARTTMLRQRPSEK